MIVSLFYMDVSDDEDRRPGRLARLQVSMGLRRLGQPIAVADLDADAPGGHVIEDLAGPFGLL